MFHYRTTRQKDAAPSMGEEDRVQSHSVLHDGAPSISQLNDSSSGPTTLLPAQQAGGTPTATGGTSHTGSKSFLSDLIADNPIFSGGLGLMVFGGAVAMLRRGVKVAASTAQRRLLISLEIPSKDRAHPWFLHWMAAQARAQSMRERGLLGKQKKEGIVDFLGLRDRSGDRRALSTKGDEVDDPLVIASSGSSVSPVRILSHELSVETNYTPHASASTPNAQAAERGRARFSLVPGPGTHWFRYRGVWMRLTRERDGKMVDLSTGAPWETVTLTTLFAYAHLFPQLLDEARQLALASTEGKTVIYTSWGPEWRPFGQPRRTRELGSVVLGKGKKEAIVGDVKRFLERDRWYAERGIPYRRGYLLHGAPGSGKSSFITALAGHLDFNICLLNLSERGLTDDKLNHLLSNAPDRSILLLEDVDAAFLGRQQAAEDGYQASVTFSGLLNALDGVASGESRIIFMTTNHIEKLDPALIRPGRVDMIAELGDAERDQVEELMVRFYRTTMRELKIKHADVPQAALEASKPLLAAAAGAVEPTSMVDSYKSFDAVPGLRQAVEDADREVRQLAAEFGSIVEAEALARRAALGLGPDGRRIESVATSVGAASASEGGATTTRRVIRPTPAAAGGVSMAELQGLFIRFPDDPRATVEAFVAENALRRAAASV
ncbi:related to BCS1 - mitochondrial protein of the AAA family of ATPases [Melanopsichium pennsylvanicum]|uniref:Related to BCS1 - mitochondrial protein of the AAA family of ATPases n=2 Tax=Melanopsichium pennsylvanicum TaxID=63383 RepID=A0AAJ4XPY2_9BASI|nr:related to BCS1-mitochondrial protein of the AAA family of ATPases [Melanopsichium pennsylvanicum 4]SNX86257.1 related to BCS1 - mitochondrial protein of the AAA family of ATPases [Melanopsichium pennsylvanicum]